MQMTFTKLPKSITAEELLSTPLPPVKWIIPGLLPAGLALFAGPSKAGKSWLTLWLCLQIAQGNPVWNREIEPRTVIYFSLEDTFNRLQNRIFQLIDGGDAPERLILQTECPSIGQGLEEQVESLIHTYRDVGLVVIDTLQKVRVSDGNGGMYANDYKEAGALKKLADKYGICILLIESNRFLLTSTVMYRTQIRLPDICVSCISNADYLRITTCTPCGISTQPICCRKAPANRWRHPCWVMRIRHSWSAPTATRRMWRNSRPQT